MESGRNPMLVGIVVGVVATLLVALVVLLGVAYGGALDIGARSGHSAATRWLLETTMRNSVRTAARAVPRIVVARADVAHGAHEYKAMCQHCHGGPGVAPDEWSRGMLPQPPELVEAAGEWTPEQVAWIVGHGIKSTGMPAFGGTHDEATLADIAAFVGRLPGMTPAQYRAFGPAEEHEGEHQGGEHHGGERHGDGDAGHGAPAGADPAEAVDRPSASHGGAA